MTRQRWLELGVVAGIMILLLALLLPAVHRAREEARKSASKNNLKQIGLALHNYHEAYACLPSGGVIREDGTAMQGWLTMYLPFMDASPDYNRINMHTAWDSPANLEVTETIRPAYLNPDATANYTSTGFGLTHYLGNPHLFYRNSGVTFDQMEMGAAHTWVTGEVAGNYQPWAYPFNWRPLGKQLCTGPGSFGYPKWKGGHLLFADGSVSFFSDQTAPEILNQFAIAPPVPTLEQMAVPDKQFETGIFHWKHVPLQTDQQSDRSYFAKLLEISDEQPILIQLFMSNHRELPEEEKQLMDLEERRTFSVPRLLLRIDKTTDLTKTLKTSPLSEDSTPEQLEANVKLLQALQSRLPQIEPGHQGI